MIMKRFLTAFSLLMIMFVSVQAQSDDTVEYTYVYHASYNESRQQAEQNAVNCAKIEALRSKYGTVLSGASATSLITKNKITESKFNLTIFAVIIVQTEPQIIQTKKTEIPTFAGIDISCFMSFVRSFTVVS